MATYQVKELLGNKNECALAINLSARKFDYYAEGRVLCEILQQKNIQSLIKQFDTVTIFSNKQIDIIFSSANPKIKDLKIEVKASALKSDYMIKSDYSKNKDALKMHGNSLKYKDFENGNLKADFLVFACYNLEDKSIPINFNSWTFYVFNNNDLQNFYPKASVFIPDFITTKMVDDKISYFTNEYSSMKKGILQLIFKPEKEFGYSRKVEEDFIKVRNKFQCYLAKREHGKLVKYLWKKQDLYKNAWKRLSEGNAVSLEGKFLLKNMIDENKCGFYNLESVGAEKDNCNNCKCYILESSAVSQKNT